MNFKIGQKVVCIEDRDLMPERNGYGWDALLKKGEIYTVRWQDTYAATYGQTFYGIRLEEIQGRGPLDSPYFHERFRPLIERKTDTGMAILRKVADDAAKRKNLVVTG